MPGPASDPSAPTGSDPTQQLRELLRQHRFGEALAAAQFILASTPGDRDALLFAAIARRFLGQIPEALKTLSALEHHYPRFSRLHEERGRCFVALRQAKPAIDAFLRAVGLNHALPGSWGMLEGLFRMEGDGAKAASAAKEAAALRALPQEVGVAIGLFLDGDVEAAEGLVRKYLLEQGDHVEGMRLLARIGITHKIYFDAQVLLAAVLERAPEYRAAREEYAFVLIELHRYEEALREVERLRANEPDNRQLKTLRAAALVGLGEHEKAISLYRELLVGRPEDTEAHLSIGHALKTLGQTQAAIESYRRAADCRPDFGDAYWSLANLKTYRFTPAEQTRMCDALASPTLAPADRYHLCFALGKALEDQGQFAESFQYYQQGNDLKHRECRYRADLIELNTQQQKKICTAEFFARRQRWGNPSAEPIFIVGLPRSGSTLLEQILASHSRVEGTQELPNVQQIVSRLRGFGPETGDPRYPAILASLSAEDFIKLGEEYLAGTQVYRSGKPFFIDKMPNNFRHVGLLHLMLPNARIIDARRDPMACCFSNFKQLFANGQEFTYSLDDIARYYRTYLEIMQHWDDVLPGRVLRMYHEDVIDDLEGSVRRLLDFCGLEFEPQCVAFHENRRSVRTASSEQVRQGINRAGVDQWKHFEPWLGPLQEALGDALTRYRDDTHNGAAADAQCNLGYAQFKRRQLDEAAASFRRALAIQPDHVPANLGLTMMLRVQGLTAEAEARGRTALAAAPQKPDVLLVMGELCADRGQFAEAETLFKRAIDADPCFAPAFSSIVLYRRMTRDDTPWLEGAEALLARGLPAEQEIQLRYAFGKYFDDIGEYAKAFESYRQANELAKAHEKPYDRGGLTAEIDRVIRRCDATFVTEAQGGASDSEQPVFVIGMPRSGTSLAEQILASHSAVHGAGEIRFWDRTFTTLDRRSPTEGRDEYLSGVAEAYLNRVRSGAGTAAIRIVDKMPANFLYAGLIHRVFPRARIIHMQRHPLDTCLSAYFQHFYYANAYTNDLGDLAHYYGEYQRVMSHWRGVLSGNVLLDVPYEGLIDDPERWTRRMLEFIGLSWEPQCLDFHRTDRVVLTASKWQVRQKINAASVGRWRNYENFIGPLRQLQPT